MTRTSERGSILISVLALALLLGFLAAIASVVVRAAHGAGRSFVEDIRAEQAARAGLEKLIAESGGLENLLPSTTLQLTGLTVAVVARNEAGRVDLNRASPELIAGVFRLAGADADLAKSLAARVEDWRDEDNDVSDGGGAESADYRGGGRADGPANRPFVHVGELALVLGMPLNVAAAAAPYFTVASTLEKINPLLADPALLMAIPGTDEAHVRDFLAQRDNMGLPFENLVARLGAQVQEYVTDENGSAWRADMLVRFGPRNVRRFEAIVGPGMDGEPYGVLAWNAGVTSPSPTVP